MSEVIAWAALLFSGISLILSIRTKRAQDVLTVRQIAAHDRAAANAGRASLTARIRKDPSWAGSATQWRVVIENRGPAEARDVELVFKEAQQLVPLSEIQRKLPLPVLPAGDEVCLIASVALGQPSKYDIILKWRDSDSRAEERVLIL